MHGAIRLTVTLGLIALLLHLVDLSALRQLMLGADPTMLVAAAVLALADRLLMIGKWYPLLRTQVLSIGFVRAARAYLAAGFASIVLPASVGGDVLRALALGRGTGVVAEVGVSILMERLLGMLALAVLALLALFLAVDASVNLTYLLPWVSIAVAVPVGAILLPQSDRVRALALRWQSAQKGRIAKFVASLGRFAKALRHYRNHRRMLVLVALLSLVEHCIAIAISWFLARSLSTSITFPMLAVAVPLTLFAARLPIAIWSLGVSEGSLVYLLGLFHVPPVEALALGLAGRIVDGLVALPGALLWADLVRSSSARRTAVPESLAGETDLEDPGT